MGRQKVNKLQLIVCFFHLFLLLGLATTSALAAKKTDAPSPEVGGTLSVGLDQEFRGFDPLKNGFLVVAERNVIAAVEERLFDLDKKGKPVPQLGLSVSSSKDKKLWTIKLRKGVFFHDGTLFNADAVVQHWEKLLDPKNRFFGLPYFESIQSVKKVDNYTVRFELKRPWPAFIQTLSSPTAMAAYIPSPKSMKAETQNRAPVGTGPFIFKEWKTNDRLVVVKNPKYWRKGKPYLDTVVFRPIPDMQARFASLLSGETDVIQTDRGASIVQAKEDQSLKVYSSEATGAYAFIINNLKPPLDDVRVRRALAYAWNQEFFVKADYKDTLPLAKDPFGGSVSCSDVGYREYDPAAAKKLLAEYGKPVTIELLHTNTPRGKEAGEIMQRFFKEVGVTLQLTPLAQGQMVKRVMTGDYQLAGWRLMDYSDVGPYLNVNLRSSGKHNFTKYQSAKMDDLLTAQQTSFDPTARTTALCGVARLINEDAIYLYGGGCRFHLLAQKRVGGLSGADHGIVPVGNLWITNTENKGLAGK